MGRTRTDCAPDEVSLQPRRFLIQVDETLKTLLSREDLDENYQITIDDKGPKVWLPGAAADQS
jgi:alpha,alpha-trehalase